MQIEKVQEQQKTGKKKKRKHNRQQLTRVPFPWFSVSMGFRILIAMNRQSTERCFEILHLVRIENYIKIVNYC